MRESPISNKRQKLIDAKKASKLEIGETIWVKYNAGKQYLESFYI